MGLISAYAAATAITTDDVLLGNDGSTTKKFSGAVLQKHAGVGAFNVLNYGAVGNGATADSTAIQAAITAASAAGGGTVYVPPGDYIIDAQIVLAQRVELIGAGWNSIFTCNNSFASTSMVRIPSTDWCRIAHLYLNGNKANQTVAVAAIHVDSDGTNANRFHVIEHNVIFSFKGIGINVTGSGEDTRIYDNYLYNNDAEGIVAAAPGTLMVGNLVGQSGLEGFRISGWNCRTIGNRPFYSGRLTAARGQGFEVTGTSYQSSNDEPQDNYKDGWHLNTCDNAIIMGGSPGDNAGAAIKITAGSYHRIETHASGGTRTDHTSILEWVSSPANCQVDVTYDPASIGANPANVGTIAASNRVTLNGSVISRPLRSEFYVSDDFVAGAASSATVGQLSWQVPIGTLTAVASVASHPGVRRLATGATITTLARLVGVGADATGDFVPADYFDMTWIVRLNDNDTDTQCRVGFGASSGGNPTSSGMWFEKLYADTAWFAVSGLSSAYTRTATGVSTSTSWVRFRLRRVSATALGFTVDDGTEILHTTHIPTVAQCPFMHIINQTAVSKTVDVDYYEQRITGLTR